MKKIILLSSILLFANATDNFYYQKDKKVFLTPIKSTQLQTFQKTNSTKIDYYKTQNDKTVGINKEFIVKIKEEKALEGLLKKYSIVVKKRLAQNLYLMEINSTQETLAVSNQLYHDANVSYAHPNFIKKIEPR
jgi:hypothetical protein